MGRLIIPEWVLRGHLLNSFHLVVVAGRNRLCTAVIITALGLLAAHIRLGAAVVKLSHFFFFFLYFFPKNCDILKNMKARARLVSNNRET